MKTWLAPLLSCCLVLPSQADVPKKSSSLGGETGLVWKIEGGKVPVYLAASFHLLRKKDLPLPASFDVAYADSHQVWCEIPPGEMEKPEAVGRLMAAGALPANKTLKDVVSKETYRKIQDWEGDPAMKFVLNRMRPWMAAMTIMLTEYQKMGVDPQHGVDKIFETKAANDGKPTGGFETVDFQIGLFSELTEKQQAEMLDQAFDELAGSRKQITELIKAWRTGNEEAVASQMEDGFKHYPELTRILLDHRNQTWIEPIEKLLAGDQKTMVIVGAGHLCGKGSVVDLLRKKGWKVRRLGVLVAGR
jgi:uncharacterized protein YbaP (TraB family)